MPSPPQTTFIFVTRLLGVGSPLLLASLAHAAADAGVNFSRQIQPILSENCYQCHGPDGKARKADLRLDRKEGMYRTKEGITVVVPGQSKASELIDRINTSDPDDLMPPAKSHRQLTEAQKQLLKRWVDEGAPWAEHWAYTAPVRPEQPSIADGAFTIRNPIDAFVAERLVREHLPQAPEADKEKLLRRVTLDLTGLPPTEQELDAFLADASADAYEKTVDRLLASPRFGERMVWEWLDAARYADTNGYQGDPTRDMWHWRDWAIKALNDNMPFDRFTIEQIAGDLLPNPSQAQLIATGFHRNHMINGEGGRLPEESRVEYVMDRTETTGTIWLGLTINCCRCHDHKFDPLRQKDYYQLSAYFNSIDESGGNDAGGGLANPVISLATPEQRAHVDELKAIEEKAKSEREAMEKALRDAQPAWEEALKDGGADGKPREVTWKVVVPDYTLSDHGTVLEHTQDGTVTATGPSPAVDDYIYTAKSQYGVPTAFKLVAEPDDRLINKGPGRADNGNFVLTEVALQADGRPVELGAVSADFEQEGWPARNAFDGKQDTGWAVMPKFGEPHTLIFEARSPLGYGQPQVQLSFRLSFQYGKQHTLGRFKLYSTTDNTSLLRPMPDNIRALISKQPSARTDDDKKQLAKYYLDTNPKLAAAIQKQNGAKSAREAAEQALPRTMVMRDRPTPRETFVLIKGGYDKPADKVSPDVPAFLPKLPPDSPQNRLALARWLVSRENPLTARVNVNRYWQTFFGIGLVKTAEDFGVQGDAPSHPELLDWLACEFMDSGWDVKHIVRLIVTSATYRQTSKVSASMAERDPENRLLSRGPRFRLQSWMLRDQALAVSGLLVDKLGGPPVKVYQPPGIWEDATFGQIQYQQDHGEALYRRSLYIFWRRIVAPPLFFDVANRQNCTVRVARTNTPLQALVTLNDVTYTEAARGLAQRLLTQAAGDKARIALGFRLCTARTPSDRDSEISAAALAKLREAYAKDPEAARKLLSAGESKPDPKLDAIELAAYTAFSSLLLNLDETLTKE